MKDDGHIVSKGRERIPVGFNYSSVSFDNKVVIIIKLKFHYFILEAFE